MAGMRNIHNTGVFVGGNVGNSSVVKNEVTHAASDDDELLEELNDLIAELLKAARQLPPQDRTVVRAEVVQFQEEIEAPEGDRDRNRITASLDKLKSVAAAAAPLAGIVKDIADIAIQLIH